MADRYTKEQRAAYNNAYNQKLREQREKIRAEEYAKDYAKNMARLKAFGGWEGFAKVFVKSLKEANFHTNNISSNWKQPEKKRILPYDSEEAEAIQILEKEYPDEDPAPSEAHVEE